MGYDASFDLERNFSVDDIYQQLEFLGYKKCKDYYYIGDDREFKHTSGISVYLDGDSIFLRTQIFANVYDLQMFNLTLKQLKMIFKINFTTDFGENTYIPEDNSSDFRNGAENGVYLAYDRTGNMFAQLRLALIKMSKDGKSEQFLNSMGVIASPESFNVNVYLSYLCSVVEKYYKLLFIALLRFSDNRESVLNKVNRISNTDLLEISKDRISVEEAVANTLSFQNFSKIASNIRWIDKKYDIGGHSKSQNFDGSNGFEVMDNILNKRHGMIHRMDLDYDYSTEKFNKDIENVEDVFKGSYIHICNINGWKPSI